MNTFDIDDQHFLYNGEPIQIISGAIHYFRVVPDYWEDRLLKLKACGFNTVETYIPWNFHEPQEGVFTFEGQADIRRFVRLAESLDLFVILRPSPFICAEWEFGGLPAWLLSDTNMNLRCYDETFLAKIDAYYDVLFDKLKPLLCTNGGPVIAIQVENEYGSYGNDQAYLQYLHDSIKQRDVDVLLFTSDGPEDFMLQGGMIPGVLETVNFGSRVKQSFAKLRDYQSQGPLMCMEFWNGWFDHWGEEHHTREASDVAGVLDEMLAMGASVNFYMFHGGTNFGFMNGANYFDQYEPTVTSYDYNTLLDEEGVPTDQYFAVRDVIGKYKHLPPLQLPEKISTADYGEVTLQEQAPLFSSLSQLSSSVLSAMPEPMEKYGQNYGYILYQTFVTGPRDDHELYVPHVHDRALVFVNDDYQGLADRWGQQCLSIAVPSEGAEIKILVENLGRVNYGPKLKDAKGLTNGVRLGAQFLHHWNVTPLPMDNLQSLNFETISMHECPSFYRGHFQVATCADTFVSMAGWTKGHVYINGFNLGRYWHIGPQQTLYVPAPLLREGENELIIFELHGMVQPTITLQSKSVLNKAAAESVAK